MKLKKIEIEDAIKNNHPVEARSLFLDWLELTAKVSELEEKLKIATDALEFYATLTRALHSIADPLIRQDNYGEKARQALSQLGKEGE